MASLVEKSSIESYLAGRDANYDNLEQLINELHEGQHSLLEKKVLEDKINKTVNLIQYRHGSYGEIRIRTINYLIKKIIEKITPSHVRYLIYSSKNGDGYFKKE